MTDSNPLPTTDQSITVLFPAYNEAENLSDVIDEVASVLDAITEKWEILVVDDGSTDATRKVLTEVRERHETLRTVHLRRNFGKSKALQVGLSRCNTDIVVLMDADGQDDPNELPKLLAALADGYDLATGQRELRNDRFVKRNTSRVYNLATTKLTGVEGKDFNSGFKAFTGELAERLDLYGELHRYIPVLASWDGFRTCEVPVNHRARLRGKTKFGRSRFWRGLLDLITVKFITTYERRPFHLLGGFGILTSFVGMALLAWMLVLRISGEAIGTRPALLAGVLLTLVGVQVVSMGLVAELLVKMSRRDDEPAVLLAHGTDD